MGRKVRGSVRSITSFVTFIKKAWNFFTILPEMILEIVQNGNFEK